MQRYELGRLLGQGTFGKVYYARSTMTNQSVAIKMVSKDKVLKSGQTEQIKREISVMRCVKHPNVIQLYEVMATKTKIYFVIEYAKGGELFDKVAKGKLKEDVAHKYFQQLVNAIDFCHSRGVYHRDIKPENLLLDENENLKVSDFGLSTLSEFKGQDGLLHTPCGTPAYVAPEIIKRKGYDGAKADTWSCGVVLFVLLAGYHPFHDSNLIMMYRKISRADYRFPSWFTPEVRRLLAKVLDPNPDTRIPLAKIKEFAWFKKGPSSRDKKSEWMNKSVSTSGTKPCDQTNESDNIAAEATTQELSRPRSINAFDIISRSKGFDLSGFFEDIFKKREARFSSRQPASVIVSKVEEMASNLRLKIKKRGAGLLKLEGLKEGRKGTLSIEVEVFQAAPCFHLVEMKKVNGDTLEYQSLMEGKIRPALKDIVWVWQGGQQQQQQQQQAQPSEDLKQVHDQPVTTSS